MFTPMMPAQDTSTPTISGSTTRALIAVMGTATPEGDDAEDEALRPDLLLGPGHLVAALGLSTELRGPHQGQLVDPVQEAGGDGLLVLEAELATGAQSRLDLALGLVVGRGHVDTLQSRRREVGIVPSSRPLPLLSRALSPSHSAALTPDPAPVAGTAESA